MDRGNLDQHKALREIEQIEDELKARGIDDLRERLAEARADLVGSLLDEQLDR